MAKKIMMCLIMVVAMSYGVIEEVVIKEARGEYILDFHKTYVTYISQDYETAVTIPEGYKFTAMMPGSRDYVSASPIQNTMYISCPVNEEARTNLTIHIKTPEGANEKLIFRLISAKSAPKILAIHFLEPNFSALNHTVEMMKSRYQDQMSATLAEQEEKLKKDVHDTALANQQIWFLDQNRKDIKIQYKGADVALDGMTNSRSDTYIYLSTTIKNGSCDVINLNTIEINKIKKVVESVAINEVRTGEYVYVYRCSQIPFPKKKKLKMKLDLTIWSKNLTLSYSAN